MKNLLTRGSVLLVTGLALIIGACGGSGSTTTPLNALAGTYNLAQWTVNTDTDQATAVWGTASADGEATIAPEAVFQNQNGIVSGPMLPDDVGFELGVDHALTIMRGGNILRGGLSEDGSLAAVAAMSQASDPGILVLGRTGSGFSNASLQGQYHIAAFWMHDASDDSAWFNGMASFDGAGVCTGLSATINSDGDIDNDVFPSFGTYTVEPAGTMTWTPPPLDIGPFEGGIYANGEIAVLTASSDEHNHVGIIVLIKNGVGLSNATFRGAYQVVGVIGSNNATAHASFSSPVAADGAGTWMRLPGEINLEGVVEPFQPTVGLPYAVTANGRLDINNGTVRGAVSQSGRFAVVSGGTTQNSQPQMWIFVR